MPPQYVKAYLKRNKNDAADAEAICEAVTPPSMRFVPVKTKEQQSALVMPRGRDLLIRQRTMLANALRGHLAEFGLIAAQGLHNVAGLIAIVSNDEDGRVPDMARRVLRVIADALVKLDTQIAGIEAQIMAWPKSSPMASAWRPSPASGRSSPPPLRRPSQSPARSTVAGSSRHGSVSCRARTPRAARRLGGISKRGDSYLRRLLVNGAHAALLRSKAARADPWRIALRGRRPRLVVAVALANKTARIAWAMMTKPDSYRFAAATA